MCPMFPVMFVLVGVNRSEQLVALCAPACSMLTAWRVCRYRRPRSAPPPQFREAGALTVSRGRGRRRVQRCVARGGRFETSGHAAAKKASCDRRPSGARTTVVPPVAPGTAGASHRAGTGAAWGTKNESVPRASDWRRTLTIARF
ncbi:hypothetical protein, conserved in T. vivax, (fragment), partial [Trypanosoma vivax Y486]